MPATAPPPVAGPPTPELITVDRATLDRMIDSALKNRDELKKKQEDDDNAKKAVEGYQVGSLLGMNATWRNGVFIESANKDFIYKIGGTVQYDFSAYTADNSLQAGPGNIGPFSDGANFRRGRLRMEGTAYEVLDFRFEMEFFNGFTAAGVTSNGQQQANQVYNSPGPTDAWIQFKKLPGLGNVRIGMQKEWFSLEHLNDYRSLEFLERSYLFDFAQPTAFNNGFTPGISVFRTFCDDRVFAAAGVYKNDSSLIGFDQGDGEYAFTTRVTGLPIFEDEGERLWHVGLAYSHRDPVNDQVQVRVRNEVRNAPFPLLNVLANTGLLRTESQDVVNVETAAVIGPVTLQGEYTGNNLHGVNAANGAPQGSVYFQAGYFETLLFLTGERRPWNKVEQKFDRVVPNEPFFFVRGPNGCCSGKGAWEVGVRYTYLDLTQKAINGGRLDDVTLGLNWYLNPNMKLQWNYDIAHRGDTQTPAQGVVQSLAMRMALDF